jgi:glutaredoxin 3
MTKSFFKQNDVEFTEIDLTKDQEAIKEVVSATGQMGVPVTKIDDEYVIGFDKATLSRLLDI